MAATGAASILDMVLQKGGMDAGLIRDFDEAGLDMVAGFADTDGGLVMPMGNERLPKDADVVSALKAKGETPAKDDPEWVAALSWAASLAQLSCSSCCSRCRGQTRSCRRPAWLRRCHSA